MKPNGLQKTDFNYLAIRPYENLNDKDVEASMERLKQAREPKKTDFNHLNPWLLGAAVILPSLLL